jgi:hypothetical protein
MQVDIGCKAWPEQVAKAAQGNPVPAKPAVDEIQFLHVSADVFKGNILAIQQFFFVGTL